jgi:hypothetical protein
MLAREFRRYLTETVAAPQNLTVGTDRVRDDNHRQMPDLLRRRERSFSRGCSDRQENEFDKITNGMIFVALLGAADPRPGPADSGSGRVAETRLLPFAWGRKR